MSASTVVCDDAKPTAYVYICVMRTVLLLLFWFGRLIDHEYASLSVLQTSLICTAATLLAGILATTHIQSSTYEGPCLLSAVTTEHPALQDALSSATPVRPKSVNCSAAEVNAIQDAEILAREYIASALTELECEGPEGALYIQWFGSSNKQRYEMVCSNFEALGRDKLSEYTFACKPSECMQHGAEFAFVDYTQHGVINLCSGFFKASGHGRNSRPSTIVHEATHFYRNGFTSDHAREEAGARYLARSFPHLAISNAENYEYFAADAYSSLRADRGHICRKPRG